MFCKYCGKELKDDAVFCPYCGRNQKTAKMARKQKSTPREPETSSTGFTFRDPDVEEKTASDQPFDSNESVQRIFGGGVFLLLTVLLTLYIPLHLAGTQSLLTFLLTIPTIIICVGCWAAFAGCHSRQMGAGGLAMISGGLVAQVAFFLVEGIALAVIAFYSFYGNFLYPIGDILDRLRISNFSSGDLYIQVLPVVLLVCVLLIACGAFLCHALRLTRRGVFLAKGTVRGETARVIRIFRVQRTMGFFVVAAACYVVKLLFSSGIYRFFRILLIPYQAIAEGLMESWFGVSGGNFFDVIRSITDRANGTGNLTELKEFFLKSFSTNGTEIVAGVVFILVLVCVIILLLQMRRNQLRSH